MRNLFFLHSTLQVLSLFLHSLLNFPSSLYKQEYREQFLVNFLHDTLPALSYLFFLSFIGYLQLFEDLLSRCSNLVLNALLRCSEIVSLSLSLTSSSASFACHKTQIGLPFPAAWIQYFRLSEQKIFQQCQEQDKGAYFGLFTFCDQKFD